MNARPARNVSLTRVAASQKVTQFDWHVFDEFLHHIGCEKRRIIQDGADFLPNSVWRASSKQIVVSLLTFSAQGRKNVSLLSLTAPGSLMLSYAPVTGSCSRQVPIHERTLLMNRGPFSFRMHPHNFGGSRPSTATARRVCQRELAAKNALREPVVLRKITDTFRSDRGMFVHDTILSCWRHVASRDAILTRSSSELSATTR